MAEYWSMEVFDGEIPAAQWRQAHGAALIEAAISTGVLDWTWIETRWGVVFEACFSDDGRWEAFRALPAVRAALDAVPDPVGGLLVYRGRGGASGASSPRRPRPVPSAGASAARARSGLRLDMTNAVMPGPGGDLVRSV
jgi:hypothetical protein